MNTCIYWHTWIIISPSLFEPFQQRWDPTHHSPMKTSKFRLVFSKHCSLKHDPPLCLQVRTKVPTWLGYAVTGSFSRGSNSTFNDDFSGKTSGLCIHKKSNYYCEGWGITELLAHRYQKPLRIKFKTKLEIDASWPKKIITPKSSSSMNIKENAYILHCHDDDINSGMAQHIEETIQIHSECHLIKHFVDYTRLCRLYKKPTFINYPQTSSSSGHSFSTKHCITDNRWQWLFFKRNK